MNPLRTHRLRENQGVLAYLGQGLAVEDVPVERPAEDVDTWRLGAHPDIVQRLWSTLNEALPSDARCLVAGGAALVHPESGSILAVALGTQYAVRLSGTGQEAARSAGYTSVHVFQTVGRTLDLGVQFGAGWVFGQYGDQEPGWLAEAYRAANL